jgi:xylulokinase
MNVTLVTELTRTMFGWDHARFEKEAATVAPGADGLFLLPYLTGERTPNLPNATGTWSGWTTRNFTPAHMARSAIEGVTFGLAYGLRRFRELGIEPSEIRLTGGGSNSALWRQICADIFNTPVVCLSSSEGAALGAAIQSRWAWLRENGSDAALSDETDRLVTLDESTRHRPDPAVSAAYAGIFQKYFRD